MVKYSSGLNKYLFVLTMSLSLFVYNSALAQEVISFPKKPIVIEEVITEVVESAEVKTDYKIYQYGRFTVEVDETGQRIIGGQFVPDKTMPYETVKSHVIFINYSTKELSYYKKDDKGEYQPIIGYAVVTSEPKSLPKELVRGTVTKIDTAPTWCPTASARKKYPRLSPGCLPFGHPENEMGSAKFEIRWFDVVGYEAVRLHGTRGYPNGNFWDEATLGCTRLNNEAIKNLVDLLGLKSVEEGIEVVLYKGNPLSLYLF